MDILSLLNLPSIPKEEISISHFINNLELKPNKIRQFKKHITSIYIVSILNEETLKVRHYLDQNVSYQAVYVLEVNMKAIDNLSEYAHIIHSAIAEPSLLIIHVDNLTILSGAVKRINKNDSNKSVVEDIICSNFTDDMRIIEIKAKDLRDYYFAILNNLYRFKAIQLTGHNFLADIDYKTIVECLEKIQIQINSLTTEYKAASVMREKATVFEKLTAKQQEFKSIIDSLV